MSVPKVGIKLKLKDRETRGKYDADSMIQAIVDEWDELQKHLNNLDEDDQ